MVPLSHSVAFGDDGAGGTLFGSAHVGFQLGALHLAIAVDGIHLAVIIEEHAQVVDVSAHVLMFPRSVYILGGVALQPLTVDVGIHIELSVGIADAGCPHPLSVNFFVVAQGEGIVVEIEPVEAIRDVLPVHQVSRVQDNQAWHGVHGGSGEVVVVAHAQDVGV